MVNYNMNDTYETIDSNEQMDFKNIDSNVVLIVFMNMVDEWLKVILSKIPHNQRVYRLNRFVYRLSIWNEMNIEYNNLYYFYDILKEVSYSTNSDLLNNELFLNFKKVFCIYAKILSEQSYRYNANVYYGKIPSIYLSKFIDEIVSNIDKLYVLCEYKKSLLNSEQYGDFLKSISANSNKNIIPYSLINDFSYKNIDNIFRSNERSLSQFYSELIELSMNIIAISDEISKNSIEMIHAVATIILSKSYSNENDSDENNSLELAGRDIEIYLKQNNRIYNPATKYINSVFFSESILKIVNDKVKYLGKSLKGMPRPPIENIFKILSEIIVITPEYKTLSNGRLKALVELSELRNIFIRLYQSKDIRTNSFENVLSDYINNCIEYKTSEEYKKLIEPNITNMRSKINMYNLESSCEFKKFIDKNIVKRDIIS